MADDLDELAAKKTQTPAPAEPAPADPVTIASHRIKTVVNDMSNAALLSINEQIAELHELSKMIQKRRDQLTDAAVEHAQFCQDVVSSKSITSQAYASLRESFANGLPPTVRLVNGHDGRA